jgi:hypothetical protein
MIKATKKIKPQTTRIKPTIRTTTRIKLKKREK